jgi:cytidylate kinase
LKEFSELVINEPNIDREIDNRTKELSQFDNTIVDAQLAVHFTPPDTLLKMCITASKEIRWDRIARRESISIEEAKNETLIREKSEQDRYFRLYEIDVWDTSFYDIIINSDRLDATQTYSICKTIAEHFLNINK